jgi:hypothetical protein
LLIVKSEVLFAAIYKSPGHTWNASGITEIIGLRHKLLLAGNLNAKHPFWNSTVSNSSGAELLNLLHINEFEISAPHVPFITALWQMVTCLILFIRMSGCQKSLSLTFWTQITYHSFSTCWILIELGILQTQLTNSQTGSGSKPGL